jgi:TonB family protein
MVTRNDVETISVNRRSAIHLAAVVVFSTMLLDSFALSQGKRSDREREGLVGQVRTIFEEGAYISGNPDKPTESSRYRVQSQTYDRPGNIVEQILYGGLGGTEVVERTLYGYDPEGHRLERSYMGGGIPDPSIKRPVLSNADKGEDGSLIAKRVIKYDGQGNSIEEAVYRGGGAFLYKDIYRYDARGRLIEWRSEHASGSSEKVTYSYTGEGNFPATEVRSDGQKVNYRYELDSEGNWIKRVGLFERSKSKSIGETEYRTIAYYGSGNGAEETSKSDAKLTTYYVAPAGLVKAVPYEVVAELNPSSSPPPGVIVKRGILVRGVAITRAEPVYPTAAKAAHISGEVKIEAVIDEEGNVIYARAISGHPLLRDAAEDSAHQWKFAPTTVDGTAVKVLSGITINFKL